MGLIPKYYLLVGDTNQVSIFSLHKIKMSTQRRFVLKLSLAYRGNVNHQQSAHHPLSTLPLGIGNTLVAFRTNE